MKQKPILFLQHCWDNHKAYLGDLLQQAEISHVVVMVEHEPLPDPADYAAIIALGGPQHVYQQEASPYLAKEEAFIRSALELGIPYLGICLGAQLLAKALGASVKVHTLTEIGFSSVKITQTGQQDPLFAHLPDSQQVFQWHSDTFDLPQGATLLATSAETAHQAFRVGKHAYGLQYHIEVDDTTLDTWLTDPECMETISAHLGAEGLRMLTVQRTHCFTLYQKHTRIMLNNFLSLIKFTESATGILSESV